MNCKVTYNGCYYWEAPIVVYVFVSIGHIASQERPGQALCYDII